METKTPGVPGKVPSVFWIMEMHGMVVIAGRESQREKKRDGELRAGRQTVDAREIYPSPENELLYRERTTDDGDFKRLVESVRENGVQAPILVSRDRKIISGHQRLRAAIEAGLSDVPVIVLKLRRSEHTADDWLSILREHNCGREKTFLELLKENLVDVDPDEAMAAVRDDEVRRATPKSATVYVPSAERKRSRITHETREFADAIKGILSGVLSGIRPVPERAIHYRLLDLNILTSTRKGLKGGFIYANDGRSSDRLSNMLTRLRLAGEVPWEWITDETRPVGEWQTYANAAEFIREKNRTQYHGFARDLMQSQSAYYEIVIEKLTIKGFIDDMVAQKYTIKTVCLRGQSSIDSRYQLAQRFKASGKKYLVLFVLSDCDPSGDAICQSTVHSLRDEFGIDPNCVKAIRVAMTHAQADQYRAATSIEGFGLELKGTGRSAETMKRRFIERHGREDCYELEAVPPEVLAEILDNEIRANIDIEAYNHEVQEQAGDVSHVWAMKKVIQQAIRDLPDEV